MFKLFINNVQVGNYEDIKTLAVEIGSVYCKNCDVESVIWKGDDCFVRTF